MYTRIASMGPGKRRTFQKNKKKSIAGPRTARVVVGFPPSASLLDLVVGAGVPKPLGTSRGVPIEMFMVPFLPVALIQRAFHRPQLALPFALETCSDSEYRIIGLSVCGSISSRNNRRTNRRIWPPPLSRGFGIVALLDLTVPTDHLRHRQGWERWI